MPAKKTFDNTQVIDQIMRLFWQNGYYHTSMDEIVATSGVKKQSLYNALGDKHTLYLKSLQHYHQLMLTATTQTMQQLEQSGASPVDILMALLTQGLTATDQPTGDLINNAVVEFATSDAEVKQLTDQFYADYLTLLASVILKGQASQTIIANQASMPLAQGLLEARIGLQTQLRRGAQPDLAQRQQLWTRLLSV
ncbi:TetR/AcrR family transcriptional regulator [Lactiplantibacillus mudanjiangensis]|uniref:TetR/AcrR family transcriptional regulator [Lactobacillus sp.] n=1 Tax=Lactiplantibacillus mudanjiangensis TaxID=1296538 RepID=A0A660DVK3_9LACO|nr:TetR/AcrR family transcriptional regulator [Lactiplantibacillus mudanjiangensis]VDG21278.1 TetR/AcrR family transcriptional regulator [Lactobacillus sp.] [Lactiplantibacillus mudanjiangensis]VDG22462.1 TetR/AcrR family transcriptional regulator [Lactobacillus sp.] [Lactiplantibacillus mudanjiangensis]VDG27005.1 TetR/AcrR family transcriptional regulator [Lactobacillus sp.] [Lactiplantibacillus mudanjiangensis]VDG32105.1 TetR/AcrR family transcriptional regulator [Lactobacillus sp.] [Lactipla